MKKNLLGLSHEELVEFVLELGEKPFRASQLEKWIYKKLESDFSAMTDLGAGFRTALEEKAQIGNMEIVKEKSGRGGLTRKYLFSLPGGDYIESVLMRFFDPEEGDRLTLCLSTQVGCAMSCAFCASGMNGLSRNLSSAEMVEQAWHISRRLAGDERIGNIVFMGIGEPFANYNETLAACRIFQDPARFGIGARHITISTCGIVPGIKRLAGENLQVRLAVSLHTANEKLRKELMPVSRSFPLDELLEACKYYQEKTGRRITFEYILIREVNDNAADARELGRAISGMNAMVNLIPLNPVDEFAGKRSPLTRIKIFKEALDEFGVKSVIRKERGLNIDAACGQLRKTHKSPDEMGDAGTGLNEIN
ncbi:MAG: 23S rRNA (adenine(2503)-C(2))-methyltransferase RlmN [Chloroflexi bacterium]|nr:23S rRNA (adenine(2503)-C(2))-methyltransferase RlmN [Chloroflexota bacterium]